MDVRSITVIVPAFNAEHFIVDALECIREQGYDGLKIIVVDDGSTDRTAQLVAQYPDVSCMHQENRGPAAARNHALERCRSEFIAFLDVDDLWPAGTLAFLSQRLIQNPDVDLVVGRVQYLVPQRGEAGAQRFDALGAPCVAFNLGAGLYRASAFKKVGRFDESMRTSEDVDWFMRAREHGLRMDFCERVTLLYRRHAGNMTVDRASAHSDFVRALKQSLDRRRQRHLQPKPLPNLAGRDRE